MQPEDTLEYYKSNPKKLIGREVRYLGDKWYSTVIGISAEGSKFFIQDLNGPQSQPVRNITEVRAK